MQAKIIENKLNYFPYLKKKKKSNLEAKYVTKWLVKMHMFWSAQKGGT